MSHPNIFANQKQIAKILPSSYFRHFEHWQRVNSLRAIGI